MTSKEHPIALRNAYDGSVRWDTRTLGAVPAN